MASGQHRKMLDQVLTLFEISPDFDLDIIQERQSLAGITTRALQRLSPIIEAEEPDMILVQGDTTTTFVGALAAFYHQVPVAHIEAGLRTGSRYSPYPEEINRRLTSQLTSLHLAPTSSAKDNLLAEGIAAIRSLLPATRSSMPCSGPGTGLRTMTNQASPTWTSTMARCCLSPPIDANRGERH